MSVWDTYFTRTGLSGKTARDRAVLHTQNAILNKSVNSLSSHNVMINDTLQNVTILNTEELDVKKIIALPGESLEHGGIVDFTNSKWLITEIDANDEIYASGFMQRCNHKLKWLNSKGEIIEKWCIVEDGTKYLIGEKTMDMMSIGDARIAITIGKDDDTTELGRGKRFLVDDDGADETLAYQITKPNRLFNIYDGKGVYRYILNEVNVTDNDNLELGIADYYNWKPESEYVKEHTDKDITIEEIVENARTDEVTERGVWI